MYLYLQHYGCYSFFYSYFVSQILFKKKQIHQYNVLHETKTTVNGDSTANWENSDM